MSAKSRLGAFFENEDDDSSFPQQAVDDQKLSQFTTGSVRKSRREKEKEAADAKRKEEEHLAAKAYAEYLDEFEGESSSRKKTGGQFVRSGGLEQAYVPSKQLESLSRQQHIRDSSPPALDNVPSKPRGKRAMDSFLEEIKRDQAQREAKYSRYAQGQGRSVTALAAYDGLSGSRDRGDTETSNVFVANLPSHVTEQSLGSFFAKVGPVGSVKIMWPRAESTLGQGADARRYKNSSGLSGFVSFMKRRDAEDALREFDGLDWGGSVLRVGWSKAVPIAPRAKYTAEGPRAHSGRQNSSSRSRSRSRSRAGHRSHSKDREHRYSSRRSHSRSRSRSRSPHRSYRRDSRSPPRRRRRSSTPIDEQTVSDSFIRAIAILVKGNGPEYTTALKEREKSNSKYSFLLDKNHRRHAFYRGLLENDRSLEPEFDDEGYNSVYSTDSAEDSERERSRKNALGPLARKRFEAMLRAMSGKTGEVARCMAFSLEHAEASSEVAEMIITSLLNEGTPVPRKVARLHLICDILHNSAAPVPSAWKFRQEFQSRLGIVFDHLSTIYHSFPGRITAETFKKQITSIVDIWEDWIVFPPEFTSELRARLEGGISVLQEEKASISEPSVNDSQLNSKFSSSAFRPAAVTTAGLAAAHLDKRREEDIDGEFIDNDVDGQPMDDVDGVPMQDVDGMPIDEDIDGAPIDDLDGEAMDESDDLDGEPIEA